MREIDGDVKAANHLPISPVSPHPLLLHRKVLLPLNNAANI